MRPGDELARALVGDEPHQPLAAHPGVVLQALGLGGGQGHYLMKTTIASGGFVKATASRRTPCRLGGRPGEPTSPDPACHAASSRRAPERTGPHLKRDAKAAGRGARPRSS